MKRTAMIAVGILTLLTGVIHGANRQYEAVLLVRMVFDQGQWRAKPLEILPCGAPSKPDPLTRRRSAFQLLDRSGKVLIRRFITNPRVILVEDPKEHTKLLSKLEFTLAVPFVEGATSFQFFERDRDYPDDYRKMDEIAGAANADLGDVVEAYQDKGRQERAPCQIIAPKPEDPQKLGEVINTAISVETITSLIARDQHLLIKRGLELDLHPKEVRRLVYDYRNQWSRVQIDEEQVEGFLKRYTSAFREAGKTQ